MGIFERKSPQKGARLTSSLILALLGIQTPAHAMEEKLPPAIVSTSPVRAAELFDLLTYPARVVSRVNTSLLAETDGVIHKIQAPLGQRVRRGQALMTIKHTDPVYQYAPISIKAPVDGVVSQIEITEGSQVVKGQKVATVTDPAQLQLSIEVPALDLGSLKKGTLGEFRLSGREGAILVKIRGISPYVDPATGTATCEIEILKTAASAPVLPGLMGEVSFKANVHRGFSIPDHALIYRGQTPYVRVVENGKARKVPVKLGRQQRGLVEILEGLQENAVLVERASRFVADGENVTVQ